MEYSKLVSRYRFQKRCIIQCARLLSTLSGRPKQYILIQLKRMQKDLSIILKEISKNKLKVKRNIRR